MSMASSLEVMRYFPLELLALRKCGFDKIRLFGRSLLIFLSSDGKDATGKCYELWPHGLDGGVWGFLSASSKVAKASGSQETSSCNMRQRGKV